MPKTAGWEPSKDIRADPTQSLWIEEDTLPPLKKVWKRYAKEVLALVESGKIPREKKNIIGVGPLAPLPLAEIARYLPMLGESFIDEGKLVTEVMLKDSVAHGQDFAAEQLSRVTGNRFERGPISEELVDTLTQLDVSALKGITDEMNKQIIFEIGAGMQAGEGTYKITERIDGVLKEGWRRAETIVRTESIRAITEASRERYMKDQVKLVELISCNGPRTCDACISMHGEIAEVDGRGFRDGWPPFHPNCRCAIAPVIPGLYDGPHKDDVESWFD